MAKSKYDQTCAWMCICIRAHTAKYSRYKALRNVCSLCFGLDDTNRRMKTNDMSETVDRDVVILLIHLTAHLPHVHTHTHKDITAAELFGSEGGRKRTLFSFPVSDNHKPLNKSEYKLITGSQQKIAEALLVWQ